MQTTPKGKNSKKFVNFFFEEEDYHKIKRASKISGLAVTSLIRSASLKKANSILKEELIQ